MMDKRTILVVIGCLIALFAAQRVIDKLYPPRPRAPRPIAAASTNAPVPTVETAKTAEKPVEAAKETKVESSQPRPAEQIVSLSNEFVQVDFTSWGGGVRSIELLKHHVPGNGAVTLNGTNFVPALSLVGVPGAGTNDVFAIYRVDAKTVLLRSANGVTKTFALSNAYLISASVQVPATLAPSGNVSVVVGTAMTTQPREPPSYLVVDWEGASKFRNRTLPRVMDRVKAGKPHED